MKHLLILLGCALLSLVASAFIVSDGNPEVQFWHHALLRKKSELQALHQIHPNDPIILFAGGSSCAFSIMPEVITERTGLPAYNLGGHAGAGPRFLSAWALQQARPGDIVVLALEMESVCSAEAGEVSQVGLALAHCQGREELAVGAPVLPNKLTWKDRVTFLRPGSRFGAAMLAKQASGQPLYRYRDQDFCHGGRIQTPYHDAAGTTQPKLSAPRHLSPSGAHMLEGLVAWASHHQVKLFFSLPWALTQSEAAEYNRQLNRDLAAEISAYLPVLSDETWGACANVNYYADTHYHLAPEGAKVRSEVVARGLLEMGVRR